VTPVDFTAPARLEAALSPRTKILYCESPANPNLRVIDIAAVAAISKAAGALTIVDNTFASPALQRPLEHGADLVVHSATKFLGGHGDLLGGVVVGAQALIDKIRGNGLRFFTGATLSPLNAFLILRGLKTLELRMARHCESARRSPSCSSAIRRFAWCPIPGSPRSRRRPWRGGR